MKKSKKICMILLLSLLSVPLISAILFFSLTAGTQLDPEKLTLNASAVHIFDCNLDPVFEEETGESVPLSALPKCVPLAFVAVEDKRFFEHGGVDLLRIGKATIKNIASFSFKEGASTISQQLVKNTHLTSKKTIKRKLKEIKLALQLEKRYLKEQILELYLNTIYFGHSAFGIESAAKFYFGKSAKALNAAEAATLAGLVKSPNRYSPFVDAEKCKARRNLVLNLMQEQKILSEREANEAKSAPLPEKPTYFKSSPYRALVLKELENLSLEEMEGLSVYTYFNQNLQDVLKKSAEENASDCTCLIRENEGGLKAFYSTCGTLERLPASTIKPLAVYGPAIEEDLICPATPILDEEINFGGYSPKNATGTYGGYMSARYALSRSVNIPAVKTLNSLGVTKAAMYLKKLGLAIEKEDEALSLALGGMKKGFTLQALCDAYATFAREGYYSPSHCIKAIRGADGKLIYDATVRASALTEKSERVFSKETCALVCDMLRTAVLEGTAKKLKSLPFEVFAKTGTAERDGQNTDAYTIAFTYEDTAAVWLGNKDYSPIEATGGGAAANAAFKILRALYEKKAPKEMPKCESVVSVALDREEYEQNHRILLMDPTAPDYLALHELFKATALPTAVSTKFQAPKIEKPRIIVKNAAVEIILCQTYYYDYEVKRECDGEISTIYRGKYRKNIVDNSVQAGKEYTYTVTPSYQGILGESVTLPSVFVEENKNLPDDWWN